MSLSELSKELKGTGFLEDLLKELVNKGFGSLPARETALTFLEVLLRNHPRWKDEPPEDYELARLLRTSPRRIRGLKDDLAYRDPKRDTDWCHERLIELLPAAERVKDGGYVTIEIDEALVRDYARKLVRQNMGVFESGLSSTVVRISGKQFAALALSVLPEKQFKDLAKVLKKEMDAEKPLHPRAKPRQLFVESFMKAAGTQAGKKGVNLAFTVLTGGVSDVTDAIDFVKGIAAGNNAAS